MNFVQQTFVAALDDALVIKASISLQMGNMRSMMVF